MTSTGDYPIGAANDPRAPYNQPLDKKVKVCISVTYHTNTVVKVPPEYDDVDLKNAVRDQIFLPGDNFKTWYEDEMEVMEE